MTILNALHGRARLRRAAAQRVRLLALLVLVPIGLRALEVAVLRLGAVATHWAVYDTATRVVVDLASVVQCLSYIVGGLAIDKFGLKRTIGLVVLVWAALVTLGATVVDPLTFRTLAAPPMALLPGFLVTSLLVALRLAWPARRRAVVVAGVLAIYQYALHGRLGIHLLADVPGSWRNAMLAAVTLGAVLFAVWMLAFVEVDRAASLDLRPEAPRGDTDAATRAMLAASAIWIILAIEFCQAMAEASAVQISWQFDALSNGAPTWSAVAIAAATPVGFLAASWMSDRLYRSRRDWLEARRLPIIVGFLVAAIAPALGLLARQSGPALQLIDLLAIGVSQIVVLLVVDCAPRRLTGRFVGLVLAGESASSFYIRHPLERLGAALPHDHVLLTFVAALAGAALAARLLPRLRPAND